MSARRSRSPEPVPSRRGAVDVRGDQRPGEGGTFAYLVAGDGPAVLCLGGSGRMLRALDSPRHVLPTHRDDFDEPLTEPAKDAGGLTTLREAVAAASPASTFTVVDHLETLRP